MKKIVWSCIAVLLVMPPLAAAQDATKGAPPMDAKAMEEMMAKMSAPGPEHARFKKMEGKWNQLVKWSMDPTQPMQESKSTAVIKTLMDGRYYQEQASGQMMNMPFSGMGITGYDKIQKKYVSIWIDNMSTGIMKSEGTASADGKTIEWTGESSDPMTGGVSKYRMVTTFINDNHYTFDMFGQMPDGKEMKMMTIDYSRKG
jgi:hypothetical protein